VFCLKGLSNLPTGNVIPYSKTTLGGGGGLDPTFKIFCLCKYRTSASFTTRSAVQSEAEYNVLFFVNLLMYCTAHLIF
jgi:hypothetical protein